MHLRLHPFLLTVGLVGAELAAPGGHAGTDAATVALARPAATPGAAIELARDIQPIFKAHCGDCHGADDPGGKLQLGSLASLLKGGVSGPAVVPGSSAKSILLTRLLGQGGKPRMPMGFAPLSAADIAAVRAWIDAGAQAGAAASTKHWAFIAPQRPPIPRVHDTGWARNPIDAFILSKLEKSGLKPSPPADRSLLLRRVSLDLTGIPPTPAELDAFLSDHSPGAYEKVVDRLLASPRYGERMAMDWLDGARYADSNGYQSDWERYQWRWRDWVIDAYNRDEPFDQFTIDQIAGDLIPNATLGQKIATGFNRNNRLNTEGGVIPEEWRVEGVIDRVETTSEVWLGLTMGCARCHDHKYDPLPQKDFYSFFAFFNNVPETGSGPEKPMNHPPLIQAPTPEQTQRIAELNAKLSPLDNWLKDRLAANVKTAASWKLDGANDAEAVLQKDIVARYVLSGHPTLSAGIAPAPSSVGDVGTDPGHATGAAVTKEGAYVDLGAVGDFDTHDKFSYGAWINPETGNGSPLSKMDKASDFRGWDLFMSGGRVAVHLINKWPDNALKVISKATIPNGQWTHVLMTYDGTARPEGINLYFNGKHVESETETSTLSATIRSTVTAKVGTRTGADSFAGKVDDAILLKRTLTPDEVATVMNGDPARALLAIPEEKRTAEQKLQLGRLWSQRQDKEYGQHLADRDAVARDRSEIENQITSVVIMDDMPKPRDCFILVRGQYDRPGEKVTAAIPAVFGALPADETPNRLALARWIASPTNPLTARVGVNRFWAKFFGEGIVRTVDDFGMRSDEPTHPELLDWLATEFIRLHWDQKAIQKEIVMSATYCQSSRVTPELLAKDPENKLLAHSPRFRLPGEVIRDQALAVSGLLSEKIGGPSVRPYQPAGVWDETSVYGNLHNYKHDVGANLYRRTLYTIWKRTAAPPEMTLFDVPTREVCRIQRSRTDTPLQALVTLNDETFVEASRVLAQKMMTEGGSTMMDRIGYGFRRAICRRPTAAELSVLGAGNQKWTAKFKADTESAKKLVAIGDTPVDTKLDVSELAAYTLTASVILNMDEVINKD